jgi:hypothetical protein
MNAQRAQPVIFVDDGYPEASEYANNYFPVALSTQAVAARERRRSVLARWLVRLRRWARGQRAWHRRPVHGHPGVAVVR